MVLELLSFHLNIEYLLNTNLRREEDEMNRTLLFSR